MNRDHFLPFTARFLSERLTELWPLEQRARFEDFCRLTQAMIHYENLGLLNTLKGAYQPLDPDAETSSPESCQTGPVRNQLENLIFKANFRRLENEELQAAFEKASPWGVDVKVSLDRFEFFEIYTRGEYPDHMVKKKGPFQKRYDFSVFSRVVIVFQLKPAAPRQKKLIETSEKSRFIPGKVYLKLFKSVPMLDLEMLFPENRIRVGWFDKARVIIPLLAGVGTTAYKIVSYVIHQGNPLKLWTQIGFWTLVGSLFALAIRGFVSYKTTVEKYLKNLTSSLYFQNLDNNTGVIQTVLGEAEEEEYKELLLAYTLLALNKDTFSSRNDLDRAAESWILKTAEKPADFDVEGALDKLKAWGLLGNSGSLSVIALSEALAGLDKRWDNIYQA